MQKTAIENIQAGKRPYGEQVLKGVAFVAVTYFIISYGIELVPGKVAVTSSPSVKYRVFFTQKGHPAKVIRGDYYHVSGLSSPYLEGGRPFGAIKRAACIEGDGLDVEGREYRCNGKWLGHAKEKTMKGEPLENFVFFGTIPTGKVFFMGDHIDSYDSRYFGFIDMKNVEARCVPLF